MAATVVESGYGALLKKGSYAVATAVTPNTTTEICTATSHGLATGETVVFTTTDTLPTGLALATTYYPRVINANTFTVHATEANARANLSIIDISNTGVGTHTVTLTPITLAEITGLDGPNIARESHDATHMESPSAAKEFIPAGSHDGGEITVELNFLPHTNQTQASVALTQLQHTSETTATYHIAFADAQTSYWNFAGMWTGYSPTAGLDDKMTASATLKLTGPVSRADAAV